MYIYSVFSNKTLAAAATQTLLVIKPATSVPLKIRQWSVSFDSAAPAAGIRVQLIRQSTDGTGAASPPTPQKSRPWVDRAAQATILHNLSAEGTLDAVLETYYVSPFGGLLLVQYPLDAEPAAIENGNRLAIRVITPAGVSPNADFGVWFEE
jgi:hypothetical protein